MELHAREAVADEALAGAVVERTLPEAVSRTGWFAPRCPNGSLNVRWPSASPSS
jgi:hypothetical protein